MQSSARRAIPYPSSDRSDKPDLPLHFKSLVDALEKDISFDQGPVGSRPANPGYRGFQWFDSVSHIMSFWDGSNWYDLGVTNFLPSTIVDGKGDIVIGLADNTPGRLGPGPKGQMLTTDSSLAAGLKWALDPVLDLVAAKGDMVIGSATDQMIRVPVGPDGTSPIADASQAAGVKWGVAQIPHKFPSTHLTANLPMTNANQFYDAVSDTLTAGRWLVNVVLTLLGGGQAANVTAKIHDGTSTAPSPWTSTAGARTGNGDPMNLAMTAILDLTSTKTIYGSAAASGTGMTLLSAAPQNSAGTNACSMTCIQLQ